MIVILVVLAFIPLHIFSGFLFSNWVLTNFWLIPGEIIYLIIGASCAPLVVYGILRNNKKLPQDGFCGYTVIYSLMVIVTLLWLPSYLLLVVRALFISFLNLKDKS